MVVPFIRANHSWCKFSARSAAGVSNRKVGGSTPSGPTYMGL